MIYFCTTGVGFESISVCPVQSAELTIKQLLNLFLSIYKYTHHIDFTQLILHSVSVTVTQCKNLSQLCVNNAF